MKKAILLFCMAMTLFATNMFAQEKVRGVETRLVETEEKGPYDTYLYAIEFTNRNSIPVSVTMELWRRASYKDIMENTKDIVLMPNESYVWKIHKRVIDGVLCDDYGNCYFFKYEAYKLL